MLYLIPAWYRDGLWSEKEQYWYVQRTQTEFDDTVKQMQLFHRSGAVPYKVLLLGYSPNFRHFLHRQGVLRAPYWSCFDAIQEIRRKKPAVFSFNNINWPVGTEFVYTPFVVLAYLQKKKFAKVEFGEDGNPIQIDMYENGLLCRRNIYDDRGFVSGSVVYKDGKELYQDYLMENGVWKARVYAENGHVIINPNYPHYCITDGKEETVRTFTKSEYDTMEELIREVLMAYLKLTKDGDLFCIAMHRQHTALLSDALEGRKTIASFFENRYEIKHGGLMRRLLGQAGYVVADSEKTIEGLKNDYGALLQNIMYISPFDSRVDFGISSQLSVQKILVPVEHMPEKELLELLEILAGYLLKNDRARVHLFSRRTDPAIRRVCVQGVRKVLQKMQDRKLSEDRFVLETCVDELSVSKCMKEQRILVDLREQPELYLQIVAISMGIPQIVKKETQFVRNGMNGRVLSEGAELSEVLDFYLGVLENWNEAMISSYEIGKEFSTEVLIRKWKEVLASFE